MEYQEGKTEYEAALRAGQKEYKALVAAGKDPYPAVLDTLCSNTDSMQDIGVLDIPAEQVVGIRSAGRVNAFTVSFLPLLGTDSEFALKWVNLYNAHMSETGITDPIICFEYLGKFYVQEGNKRVSVLRYCGAPRITAHVKRVLPPVSEEPRIKAYYEFLDFYKSAGIYQIQFRNPGDYTKLLAKLGKDPGEIWTDAEKRSFSARYQYFREAWDKQKLQNVELLPEEALLVWLQIHPFSALAEMTAPELEKTVSALLPNLETLSQPEAVELHTAPLEEGEKPGLLTRLLSGKPEHLHIAFVHPLSPERSRWINGHDLGRKYLEDALGDQITVRSYYGADTPAQAEELMEQAVRDGANVVFTTTPGLSRVTLRFSVTYPKVRFLNCSVDTPYASFRTYYCRIYEAKFITGAIAGAMANNDRIGYIGSNPIFGVPASINAFALGAQLTNPRAKISLRWSCLPGNPQADFLREGMQVITNREVSTPEKRRMNFFSYGTYFMDSFGALTPLASPCWLWGRFYEKIVRSILSGSFDKDSADGRAVNYWWGFDSDVIDVEMAPTLPEGCNALANILKDGIRSGAIDPFRRRIVAQDGTVINDGSRSLTPDEILRMDWLCDNVIGSIPAYEELEPYAQPIVRQLGLYRDSIPVEKEGSL